jgi:hypothetical protein
MRLRDRAGRLALVGDAGLAQKGQKAGEESLEP